MTNEYRPRVKFHNFTIDWAKKSVEVRNCAKRLSLDELERHLDEWKNQRNRIKRLGLESPLWFGASVARHVVVAKGWWMSPIAAQQGFRDGPVEVKYLDRDDDETFVQRIEWSLS